ncbi:MAG TPA: M28 family peptidase [Polyangia bacterium]|nr:M28 family peptidase [Polyangia bacterium]
MRILIATIVACAMAGPALGSPAEELVVRAFSSSAAVDDLRELTDGVGGRPSGSAALERAVDWAIARFRAAGVDAVRGERYDAPRVWLAKKETAELIAPAALGGRVPLRVAAMPFAQATPAGGREAEVVDVGHGDDAGVAAAGRVAGRFALVHTDPMRSIDDLFKEYLETPPLMERLKKAGAAGVLYLSNRPARLLYRHNATLDGSAFPLIAALVEREGGLRLARLVASGAKVRVKLTVAADMPTRVPSRNVVAEIRGRDKPDEVVILGAHLDSWDLGRGALDNGCNVALVLDVARALAAMAKKGERPRRTVRFMLYTGEEAGLWGSLADARARRSELDRVRAQIVFDEGSGRTSGFSLGGRSDLKAAVDAALQPLAGLGPFTQTVDAFVGTDNYDYLVEGVPTLVANQEGAPYLPDYHAESDTFDKVDLRELHANVAIAGALTWALADRAEPAAPRQNRAEVEALLKATGLDTQMRVFGLWSGFESGARGRAR